jgi:hypothetical protein
MADKEAPTGPNPEQLNRAAQDAAASLSARVHERELLQRAAAMIDPDTTESTSYEARMDWLAKYREVTS